MKLITATALLATVLLAGCGQDGADSEGASVEAGPPAITFAEVTDSAILVFQHFNGGTGRKYLPEIMGAGGSVLDFDGDGAMDLYLVQSGWLPGSLPGQAHGNRLLRNRGDGTFQDVTATARVGHTGYGMGSVAADYDNDGDPDLYVVNFGANVLYRNNGNSTFTDVTLEAGVGDTAWGSSASFLDADQDGHLDLYVVNYLEFSVESHIDCGTPSRGFYSYCTPDVYPMAPDVFYKGNGDGTFSDATAAAGLTETTGKGLGVVAADLTGDGWTDLYVANDSTPNFLFENRGDGRFDEVGMLFGVSHNEDGMTEAGMGTDAGDLNGDGWPDLIVTNLSGETNALYLGGEGLFSYATRSAGLYAASFLPVGFGVDLLDLDNDADLDLVVANGHVIDNIHLLDDAQSFAQPVQLFVNDGAGNLQPAPAGELEVPRVGRGTLTLDYDNDGRLDLVVTENNGPARLYRNTTSAGHWIGFDIHSPTGERDALGTRITVTAGESSLTEEKKAGSSYQTSSDPRLHFGLGSHSSATVTITWPGGHTETHGPLAADRYYGVRPGKIEPKL